MGPVLDFQKNHLENQHKCFFQGLNNLYHNTSRHRHVGVFKWLLSN
jgi:hypothetical protein